MRFRYTVVALLWPCLIVFSQTPLSIGDPVPDIQFENILNYPAKKAKLSEFKSELVILDFWATWCTSCLHGFPKLDSLQQEFKDQLQVLLINTNNTGDDVIKVEAFYKKWKSRTGQSLELPTVVNDTLADKLFRHQLIPHYIWIKDGKLLAVTSSAVITAENIRAILNGTAVAFTMKRDQDTERPVFSTNDLPATGLLNYSVFVKGWFDGLPSGNRVRRTDTIIHGRAMTNSSLLDMYKTAMRGIKANISERQVRLLVKDSSKLLSPFYTLDIIVPVEKTGDLYPKMLELLNNYSGYHGRFKKQKQKCWLLVRSNKVDQLKTKGGAIENSLWEDKPYLKNGKMDMLVERLNSLKATGSLVVDETGYSGKIDIAFGEGLDSMKKIQDGLGKYGLRLKEGERWVEIFEIIAF